MQLAKELSIAEKKDHFSRTLCTKAEQQPAKVRSLRKMVALMQPPQLSLLLLYYFECSILIHRFHHFQQKKSRKIYSRQSYGRNGADGCER